MQDKIGGDCVGTALPVKIVGSNELNRKRKNTLLRFKWGAKEEHKQVILNALFF